MYLCVCVGREISDDTAEDLLDINLPLRCECQTVLLIDKCVFHQAEIKTCSFIIEHYKIITTLHKALVKDNEGI